MPSLGKTRNNECSFLKTVPSPDCPPGTPLRESLKNDVTFPERKNVLFIRVSNVLIKVQKVQR